MPEFGSPFSVLSCDKKLTHEELVRAVRFLIASEYEAIQLYAQIAEASNNPLADAVLRDIANEEKVHAGELLRLLQELDPLEAKFYHAGAKEVEEEIEEISGSKAAESSAEAEKVAEQETEPKQKEASPVETTKPKAKPAPKAKKPAAPKNEAAAAPAPKAKTKAKPATAEKKPAPAKSKKKSANSASAEG